MEKMKTSWCLRIYYKNYSTGEFNVSVECFYRTREDMRKSPILATFKATPQADAWQYLEKYKVLTSEKHNTRVYLRR